MGRASSTAVFGGACGWLLACAPNPGAGTLDGADATATAAEPQGTAVGGTGNSDADAGTAHLPPDGTEAGSDSDEADGLETTGGSELAPCFVGEAVLQHGESREFFSRRLAPVGERCNAYAQTRVCDDGTASGDEAYAQLECFVKLTDDVLRANVYENPEGVDQHNNNPQLVRVGADELVVLFTQSQTHYGTHNDGRVLQSRSEDGGMTWSQATTAFDIPNEGDRALGIHRRSGGRLVVTTARLNYPLPGEPPSAQNQSNATYGSRVSDDDGASWTLGGTMGGFPYGRPIDVGSTLVSSAYWGAELPHTAGLWRSDDGGVTWGAPTVIFPTVDGACRTETALVWTKDGLLAVTRAMTVACGTQTLATDYFLLESRSKDGGWTWSPPVEFSAQPRGGPVEFVRLQSGNLLMCFTDRVSPDMGRGVRCRLSQDDGMTWSPARHIYQNNVHWDMGYSTTVQLPNDRIVSTYYTNSGESLQRPNEGADLTIQRATYYEDYFVP